MDERSPVVPPRSRVPRGHPREVREGEVACDVPGVGRRVQDRLADLEVVDVAEVGVQKRVGRVPPPQRDEVVGVLVQDMRPAEHAVGRRVREFPIARRRRRADPRHLDPGSAHVHRLRPAPEGPEELVVDEHGFLVHDRPGRQVGPVLHLAHQLPDLHRDVLAALHGVQRNAGTAPEGQRHARLRFQDLPDDAFHLGVRGRPPAEVQVLAEVGPGLLQSRRRRHVVPSLDVAEVDAAGVLAEVGLHRLGIQQPPLGEFLRVRVDRRSPGLRDRPGFRVVAQPLERRPEIPGRDPGLLGLFQHGPLRAAGLLRCDGLGPAALPEDGDGLFVPLVVRHEAAAHDVLDLHPPTRLLAEGVQDIGLAGGPDDGGSLGRHTASTTGLGSAASRRSGGRDWRLTGRLGRTDVFPPELRRHLGRLTGPAGRLLATPAAEETGTRDHHALLAPQRLLGFPQPALEFRFPLPEQRRAGEIGLGRLGLQLAARHRPGRRPGDEGLIAQQRRLEPNVLATLDPLHEAPLVRDELLGAPWRVAEEPADSAVVLVRAAVALEYLTEHLRLRLVLWTVEDELALKIRRDAAGLADDHWLPDQLPESSVLRALSQAREVPPAVACEEQRLVAANGPL